MQQKTTGANVAHRNVDIKPRNAVEVAIVHSMTVPCDTCKYLDLP